MRKLILAGALALGLAGCAGAPGLTDDADGGAADQARIERGCAVAKKAVATALLITDSEKRAAKYERALRAQDIWCSSSGD